MQLWAALLEPAAEQGSRKAGGGLAAQHDVQELLALRIAVRAICSEIASPEASIRTVCQSLSGKLRPEGVRVSNTWQALLQGVTWHHTFAFKSHCVPSACLCAALLRAFVWPTHGWRCCKV